MRCPYCGEQVAQLWQDLYRQTTFSGKQLPRGEPFLNEGRGDGAVVWVKLQWMKCHNPDCGEVLVTVHRRTRGEDEVWFAVPRREAPRPLDPLVKDPFRRDYLEAAAILSDSARMSSVLSRSILADLLKRYAGRNEYNLASRIDEFIADPKFPSSLKENLHHLREIADFGAHTQQDKDTGTTIEVTQEEAEWTLDILDGLFDYFIIRPEKDRLRREAFDNKMAQAGRKPIKQPNS